MLHSSSAAPSHRVLMLAAILLTSASTAHAASRLTIESVDGDRAVIVTDGKTLEPHPAKQGEELHFWDVIQTSKRAAAKIRYPDGSLLVVGRDTKFTIQPQSEGTQFNQLDWGQVRAQIVADGKAKPVDPKEPKEPKDPKAIKPPPRFVIRTRTAVMGVRGTDFVAGFDPGSAASSLHTIEGSVDISSSESAVMAWQGTPVNAGQTASMDTVSSTPEVAAFKPEEYKAQIQTDQPELSNVPDRPPGAVGAPTPPNPDEESSLSLLSFRVGAMSILQNSKIQYTNVALSWNPVYRVFSIFSVRGHAGGTRVKNAGTGNEFPVLKFGVLADVELPLSLHAEAGVGRAMWMTDTEGTHQANALLANVVWRFAAGKWLDSIHVGATMLANDQSSSQGSGTGGTNTSSGNTGNDSMPFEVSAGVGMRF